MAGAGLLALLDDIASLMDDVAVYSKIAAKKTAGVLSDDLAVNAQQVSGASASAERELPIVWAVAKGSFLNKLILVPVALLLSAVLPWLITPILIFGGVYLCYEGFEKALHDWQHRGKQVEENSESAVVPRLFSKLKAKDWVAHERTKIRGAIRTDFILSIEIIVIALGTVQDMDLLTQAIVVSLVAVAITIGVYTVVAGIVRLDDAGLAMMKSAGESSVGRVQYSVGQGLLYFAPKLMKALGFIGMVAMFLVGGGILVHNVPVLHHLIESLTHGMAEWGVGLLSLLFHLTIGVMLGALALLLVKTIMQSLSPNGDERH